MKFTLEIDCDNDFFTPPEADPTEESRYYWAADGVRRMLDMTAHAVPTIVANNIRAFPIGDFNGNRVGRWSLSDMDGEPAEPARRETLDEMLARHERELTARDRDQYDCGES